MAVKWLHFFKHQPGAVQNEIIRTISTQQSKTKGICKCTLWGYSYSFIFKSTSQEWSKVVLPFSHINEWLLTSVMWSFFKLDDEAFIITLFKSLHEIECCYLMSTIN